MPVQAGDIPDLVSSTLRKLGRNRVTNLATDLQKYPTVDLFMKKGRTMEVAGEEDGKGGYEFQFQLMIDSNGSARSVGLAAVDILGDRTLLTSGTHNYRHITGNYWFELRAPVWNQGEAKIEDYVTVKRWGCEIDMIKLLEQMLWRVGASGSTDFNGIPYWIVKSATDEETNQGFNGLVPSGYSTVGGVNPTTYPRWANYAGPYTDISESDLVIRMDKAMDRTYFKPPIKMSTYNTGDSYTIFTNQNTRRKLKQVVKANNDDLGFDLDPAEDKMRMRRIPIEWVPQLDVDTTGPLYGINWGEMKLAVLPGWWMRDTRIAQLPQQHTVTVVYKDCSGNTFTRDRRCHWVLSNGTTMF